MKDLIMDRIIGFIIILVVIGSVIAVFLWPPNVNNNVESLTTGNNFVIINKNSYGCDIVYHKSTKVVYSLINRSSNIPGTLTPLYDSDGSILLYDPEDWDSLKEDAIA